MAHSDAEPRKYTRQEVIDYLQLEGHIEGGFFRQTFKARDRMPIDTEHGPRTTMTAIFYLLTSESPIGHFHINRSDIQHFFHTGDPVTYYMIHPDGRIETQVMGSDLGNGELLQMTVPGGVWKASRIPTDGDCGYTLIGEAVSPGFDYADMTLGYRALLLELFPQHRELVIELSHAKEIRV